jgi:hypothetical protein
VWPKDSGSWGVVLAILAILLTVPLSMVGNMLTPKFQNWWARRSRLGIEQRIKSLRAELAEMEKYPALSETEDYILINGQVTQVLILSFGYVLAGVGLVLREQNVELKVLILFGFVFLAGTAAIFSRPVYKYRRMRSPMFRTKIVKQIEELGGDLKRKVPLGAEV